MTRKLAGLLTALVLLVTVVTPAAAAVRTAAPAAGGSPAAVQPVVGPEVATPSALPSGPTDSTKVPHYFGPYSNWANSPQVMANAVVTIGLGATTPVTLGNALIARAYATDFVTPGSVGRSFVVLPGALPAGTLNSFQTWNQALAAGSPTPSAGNAFNAYVLRPTGTANQWQVVYDSGPLTVPALVDPTVSEMATFPVAGGFAVLAGDVLAFYGEGVPVDTGIATSPDTFSFPATADAALAANVAPAQGATIAIGTDPGFPLFATQDRTYSFAASVTPTVVDPGTGATATPTVDPKTGAISAITVTNPGAGYVVAPKVTITSPGVTPTTAATATAQISTGVVNSIAVNEPGFGFTTPSVALTGGNPTTPATAIASGGVDNVIIVSGGGVYTTQAIVTFDLPDQVGGVRATGTATFDVNGAINDVTIVDPGSGYSFAPGVTITDAGVTPVANPAVVTTSINIGAITVTNGGNGYDAAPSVDITDLAGNATVPATATASVAVKGAVTGVTVTAAGAGYLTPGIRKFVDTLPGLGPTAANNLGNYIPVAVPDTTTYPGADYYEIGVVQYRQQFHSDVPATLLRGYVQLSTSVVPGKHVALVNENFDPAGAATPVFLPDGTTRVYGVDDPSYLGPTIVATKDKPVRILFRNLLPTGVAGNLFLPVDTTLMGSGMGPDMVQLDNNNVPVSAPDTGSVMDEVRNPACGLSADKMGCFTEDRATLHLHGGVTPWISDGTPHQWITPAGDGASYPKGVSVSNVPDMPDPGPGAETFFYTNQQSARLMFYHDHAWGITRLNVYAGEAAAYVVTDATEQALIAPGGALDGLGIGTPLVIQDKTFVPDNILTTDPTWDSSRWGGTGSLWAPHVYMPAQNPSSPSGMSAFGRWMYGPWFWPPARDAKYGAINNPYFDATCNLDDPATWQYQTDPFCEPAQIPGTPNISVGMEAFNDTPIVNGTAYPTTTVDPKAYRFRILNAANDRFWNLQWYVADPTTGTLSEVALKPAEVAAAQLDPNVFPTPDLTKSPAGPSWVQIGTEGGFLPTPTVVPNQPITWIIDPTRFDVGNVDQHSLLLAPAERADVIVDFSAYRGKTLILYNDAPAAFPARVSTYDYYTGGPDLSPVGAPTTLPGYGPNTRTIMQVKVSTAAPAVAWDRPNTTADRMGALMAAFGHHLDAVTGKPAGVFESGSDPIIVGQAAYNEAYGTSFASSAWCNAPTNPSAKCDGFARIQEGSQPDTDRFKFDTLNGAQLSLPFQPKGMHDEMNSASFDEFGRMTANLGLEAPGATPLTQNIILYPYVNPATEVLDSTKMPSALNVTPIAVNDDGTQIWKLTHNGVDTHPIHFHLYDVQVLNRVTWDNIIMPPEPSELGWKDTVRVSPLQDTIVALRPIVPVIPFGVPDSKRPLNPAMPIGARGDANLLNGVQAGFNNTDSLGNPIDPIINEVVNFSWEYVFHCHILSHEEMDMMRPVTVKVPNVTPPAVVQGPTTIGSVVLHWTDPTPVNYLDPATWANPQNEIGFKILRADVTLGVAGPYTEIATAIANSTTWSDTTGVGGQEYSYEIVAFNEAGPAAPSNSQNATFGLDVTASSATVVYGDPVPTITYAYLPTSPAPATNPTCSTSYAVGSGVGTYPTTCSGIGTPDPTYGTSITYISGLVTVTPAAATVIAPNPSIPFGSAVPALPASYTGLVAGQQATVPPAVCTTTYTQGSAIGTYPVTCTDTDPNYTFTFTPGVLTVTAATLTITASSGTMTYGGTVPTITPAYAGLVAPDLAPATLPTCSTTATSTSPVGTYPSTCSGAADPNYTISYVAGSVSVTAATLTITASSGTMTYGGTVPTITPAYAGLVAGDTAPATPPTCSTTATSTSPVGTYPSTCSGAADPNYAISYVAGSVSVTAATLTITASSGTMTYGGTVPAITPAYAGLVNGATAPATLPVCSTTATSTSPVGTYPSTCSGAADPNYTIAYVPGTVTVTRATLTITASSGTMTYGGTVPTITPSYAGLVAPDTASATLPVCSTTATSTSPVGTYPSTCSGAADPNYTIAYVPGTVTVTRATLTITASSGTMTYGGTVPTITPAYAGLVAGNTRPATLPVCTTTATSTSNVGTYPSTCSGAADPNYAISYVAGSVTITKASQTITFAALADRAWGSPTFAVNPTASSGLPVSLSAATPATCAVSGNQVFLVSPGLCTITASQAGNVNYLAALSVSRSFNILQAASVTTVTPAFNPTKVGAPASFSVRVAATNPAAGTPTGNVQLIVDGVNVGAPVAVNASGLATLSTTTIALGVHSVTVRYAGDVHFFSSTSAPLSYTVVARLSTTTGVVSNANPSVHGQTVTFTAAVVAQNASLGVPTGTVQFRRDGANLGAAVTLSATGTATVSTNGSSTGTHAIVAIYSGSTNFLGSTSPTLTQTVNRAATRTTLSLTSPASRRNTLVYRATVAAVAPGVGVVSGTVRFFRGNTQIGTATLANGVATLNYRNTTLALATYQMHATYVQSTNFNASTSPNVPQQIIR